MNCLITQTGEIIDCNGVEHNRRCRLSLGYGLQKFFENGGIRVKIWMYTIFIESDALPTLVQKTAINSICKDNVIYSVVSDINDVYKERNFHRQIKRINLT